MNESARLANPVMATKAITELSDYFDTAPEANPKLFVLFVPVPPDLPWWSSARPWWSSATPGWYLTQPAPSWWSPGPPAPPWHPSSAMPWWSSAPQAPPWWSPAPSAMLWWSSAPPWESSVLFAWLWWSSAPTWWSSVPSASPWPPTQPALPWLPDPPQTPVFFHHMGLALRHSTASVSTPPSSWILVSVVGVSGSHSLRGELCYIHQLECP